MALRASRVIGQSTMLPKTAMSQSATEKVHTATLLRGRVYFYKETEFKLGTPTIVSKEVADVLAELQNEVKDKDGETLEKPIFHVQFNVPKPVTQAATGPVKEVRRLPVKLPSR